jgi:hypothetical protein
MKTDSETIKNTQITKAVIRTDSRFPAKALADKGRANKSMTTKIEHTTRNWRKLGLMPPRMSMTTVNIAREQRPKMPRNTPHPFLAHD